MWSDQASSADREHLVASLRSVLPSPSASAVSFKQELSGDVTLEQIGGFLHHRPGFALVHATNLDGGSHPYIFHEPLVTLSRANGLTTVTGRGGELHVAGSGFDVLEAALTAWCGPREAYLVGFVSYDSVSELEDVGSAPPADFSFPDFWFGLYDAVLVQEDSCWNVAGTAAWTNKQGLAERVKLAESLIAKAAEPTSSRAHLASASSVLSSKPDRSTFEQSVRNIVDSIRRGDIFQTNLCRRVEAPLPDGQHWDLFRRMRSLSPAQYEAFLRVGLPNIDAGAVLSISPELFLRLNDGILESAPIKGTRPRGATAQEDAGFIRELLTSEKDRAELAMIVDVVRNDLGRVCETGSVEVTNHAELMTLPTLHHSYSTVRGRMRSGMRSIDALRAAFPAASITGAPKIAAIRAALNEEGQRRGPCMGAIGWFSMDNRMELSVAIRTAFAAGGVVRYYAGCGITTDSVAETEFDESQHKILAFAQALGAAADTH